MRGIKGELEEIMKANPDLLQQSASYVFKSFKPEIIVEEQRRTFTPKQKRRKKLVENRKNIRIGIPRLLNMYSMNPLFSAYFESLGIKPVNILYSEFTSEEMFKEGAKRGSIDPCFPSKVGIPHVHNLLYKVHPKKKLDIIFFPMIDDLPSPLVGTTGHRSCPTVSATPEAVKAAFTKEGNLFDELGIKYINTFVNPLQPLLFARQMFNDFADIFGLTESENKKAVDAGYKALDEYKETLQNVSRDLLKQLEEEDKIGIVVLGRPYHNDPGINHEIMVEFQKLGFPIFTQEALPIDKETLYPLFKEDLEKGIIDDPLEIKDVW
ncbi:CoA activase, partial [candidate division KSB1 bacterium]|nr:CoA activase [candidate division KSB1 bacterium]